LPEQPVAEVPWNQKQADSMAYHRLGMSAVGLSWSAAL